MIQTALHSVDFSFGNPEPSQVLDPVIYCICESMHTEKIFLLGTYQAFPGTFDLEYDLLVLIDSTYTKPMHEFESLIANRCHDFAMVTASVHKTDTIDQLLQKGNYFFSNLCRADKLVFDRGKKLLIPHSPIKESIRRESREIEFAALFSKAKSFFSGAKSYSMSSDYQLAAFMLHQTVEQGLNALLIPLIGYRLQTHNLNKLFLYVRRLSCQLCTVFPRDTDAEIRLFQILQKAYIYGRYKNNFQIGPESVQILLERSADLLKRIQVSFYEKLEEWQLG